MGDKLELRAEAVEGGVAGARDRELERDAEPGAGGRGRLSGSVAVHPLERDVEQGLREPGAGIGRPETATERDAVDDQHVGAP
jgi:hypothetical protein